MSNSSVHFYKKGEKQNNMQCKRIAFVDLSIIEEIDGKTRFEVTGRGDFFEILDWGGKEITMNFETTILVQGDDILNEEGMRVNIYDLRN